MAQHTYAIGVICHELGNAYYGGILYGVAEVAGRAGVAVIALEGSLAELSAPLWAADHVAGWVVVHPHQADLPALQALCGAGRPVVTVGTTLPGTSCSFVHVDHYAGMRMTVAHLVGHGHSRIACVDHGPASWMRGLVDGYRDALAEHGIPFDPDLLLTPERIPVEPGLAGSDVFTRRGELAAMHLLAAGLPCTALVTGPDLTALGAMGALQAGGCRVPEDVAVIGFDDIGEAQSASPTLTTVRQRFDDLGRAAAAQLLTEIGGGPPRPVALPITLLRRASCGCDSIDDLLDEQGLAGLDGPGWEDHLARLLVQAVRYPVPLEPGVAPTVIWPGVTDLVAALAATVAGSPLPDAGTIARAWGQAVALTDSVEALELCLSLLAVAAGRRSGGRGDVIVSSGLRLLRRELLRARAAFSDGGRAHVSRLLEENHSLAVRIPAGTVDEARSLSWLAGTSVRWGCLGLWDEAGSELELAGVHWPAGGAPTLPQRPVGATAFPPAALLAAGDPGAEVVLVLPVRTGQRRWGALALAVPAQQQVLLSANSFDTPLALLAGRLGRDAFLRELEAQQETLRAAYERERMLAQTIQELGCPVIPLLEGVLLVPLVGGVDSQRAQQIIGTVLEAVSREQAQVVLLDITGVAVVDTQVANALVGMARATTLLGARVVLVGIRPEIAQSIVGLGIDLGHIATSATLASALRALPGRRA